jgi:hypothetical protein
MGLAALTALSLSGCYTIVHEMDTMPNITMDAQNGRAIRHFKEETRFYYLLWGLVPIVSPPMEESFVAKVRKGGHIANVRINQQANILDILIAGVTGGLVTSRTVNYEGDVLEGTR